LKFFPMLTQDTLDFIPTRSGFIRIEIDWHERQHPTLAVNVVSFHLMGGGGPRPTKNLSGR
jgi:hypothetical protein